MIILRTTSQQLEMIPKSGVFLFYMVRLRESGKSGSWLLNILHGAGIFTYKTGGFLGFLCR